MPLQKDYETPSTGALASYHVVQQVSLDYVSTLTGVTVASYLSKEAKDAGRFPMYAQQIQIAGLPEAGADAREFAEAQLVAAIPADATAQTANRYAFSGAQVVE
ncbi:hypothetical protein [Paraburkholderia phenoliruptrix]|uniref:hypothetical protein n=1 Tax=Paraburkholderia phenoliruptrix TaxID=252970 RepID=UPI001C4FF4A8|nr:hypothetical protein [Paraburkholderia phenoliruptrix]MBW0450831.1 hypothetical protein [Paraburkholderia phenoliruptrix]MBW9100924.1 hypothetical protein [Paraburkholderia phenoliruptrix]